MQDVADGAMETMQCWCDWERSLEHWGWAMEMEGRTKLNAQSHQLCQSPAVVDRTLLWGMSEVSSVPSEGGVGSDAQQHLGM